MIVMPANNAKNVVHYWAGRYPRRIGWLMGPSGWRNPVPWIPYALDNGKFSVWAAGKPWDVSAFMRLVETAAESPVKPRWLVVPDSVGDRSQTLREWDHWAPRLAPFGIPLAMAVQDGMAAADVPGEAAVVFIGGTKRWKQRTLHHWCESFRRVHVGRVNGGRMLWECHRAGVESCDGTGWFRGDKRQLGGLERYLERTSNGQGEPQSRLFA